VTLDIGHLRQWIGRRAADEDTIDVRHGDKVDVSVRYADGTFVMAAEGRFAA